MKRFFALFIVASVLSWSAYADPIVSLGDEDPFPLACINFSGFWHSDHGVVYHIEQHGCSCLTITTTKHGVKTSTTTIIPDDIVRKSQGNAWRAEVRHRWDRKEYGSELQSYTTVVYADHTETSLIRLEILGKEHVLVESSSRTVAPVGLAGAPQESNSKEFFRYALPLDKD